MPDPHSIERDRLLNDLSSSLSPAPAGETEVPPPLPPKIPDHELVRCIGRGSYGEVWLARSVMGPWRAVKIVYRRSFDHDRPYERELAGIRRFEPVSRTHPSQLHILHVGRNDDAGCFYYIMELADRVEGRGQRSGVRGQRPELRGQESESGNRSVSDYRPATTDQRPPISDLRPPASEYVPRTLRHDLLRRGRVPFDECLRIGLALATALDHLHRHGLVHRDVKPSNIIFIEGIPKLADIGLVAAAEATLSMVGTEGYVPPEGPGTPQADLFSLGKVLYEMATGRDRQEYPELPTNLVEQGPAEMERMTELNEIILRACQPDPRQRYQTAAELHADLALLQSGKSVTRMRAMERRLRWVARAGAIVTAVAALAALAFFIEQRRTEEARELARQNRLLADTQSRLAEEKTLLAEEQTRLARDLAQLGEENRQRIVRLNIANGVRLLDQGDAPGALLWFADALPFLADHPDEASIHRIRIQQTLHQTPRVLQVFPHDNAVTAAAFSPDGTRVATGTSDGQIRLWNAIDGTSVSGPSLMGQEVRFLRFTRDGSRLLASSSWEQGLSDGAVAERNCFAVLDATSGRILFSPDSIASGAGKDLVCAHFSPDDRWLATSDKSHVIRLFDLRDNRQVTEIGGHTDEVRFLSFSPDGSLLASASLDRTARVWRLPSGEPAGPPLEHTWPVVRALLTDDGQHLVTAAFPNPGSTELGGNGQSEVQVWEWPAGKRLGEPIPTAGWIALGVAPGSDGRFYLDGLRIEPAKGVHAYAIRQPSKPLLNPDFQGLHAWDFSPDGKRIALANGGYVAQVFEAQNGRPVTEPLRHGRWGVNAVKFSPDGHRLLTASSDGNARIWDLRPAAPPFKSVTLPVAMQKLRPQDFDPEIGLGRLADRTPLFLEEGSLRLYDPQLEELHQFRNPFPGMKYLGIYSAWRSDLWAMRRYEPDENAVLLWRPAGELSEGRLLDHPSGIRHVLFTRDDQFLITLGKDAVARFWRTADGTLERSVPVPEHEAGTVWTVSPDGHVALCLRAGLNGPIVSFFDLDSAELAGEPQNVIGAFLDTRFSPSGSRVAFLDLMGRVVVLDARTSRVVSSSIAHSSNLIWVDWHPDGRRLLTAGHDDQVLVWDAESGLQLLGPIRTPDGIVRVARWSSDGRFIVTRNDAREVRLWDGATGEAVTPPLKHDGEVAFARMTQPDRLMTASYPDQLRAWDLRESALPADVLGDYAQLVAGRQLSATGALLVLPPEKLAALARSLRHRAPGLFR